MELSISVTTAGQPTARTKAASKGSAPVFTPIGIGKPMSLEMLTAYVRNIQ